MDERDPYLTINHTSLFVHFIFVVIVDPESLEENLVFI